MRVPYVRAIAIAYIEFCRATPILVQLLWVNYVWPEIFGFPQTVTGAGIIALALQSSGYLAETFRSGFEGLPKGQSEAALAVGMNRWRIVSRIEMPQVALVIAPLVINQLAVVVKSSTLVSVIAISDLMYIDLFCAPVRNLPGSELRLCSLSSEVWTGKCSLESLLSS
jgi:polar amino acid transport system permease protein